MPFAGLVRSHHAINPPMITGTVTLGSEIR
jgi:hypothetical protein